MNATLNSSPATNYSDSTLSKSEIKLIRLFLIVALVLLPLPFGGIHEQINLPYSLLTCLVCAWICLRKPAQITALYNGSLGKCSQIIVIALFATIAYCLIQYACFSLSKTPHPILGLQTNQINLHLLITGIREWVNFLCVFILARTFLHCSKRSPSYILRLLIGAGTIVSAVALLHWFRDNGKLFGIFEPESVFTSERARWPFVNANHLGDYLSMIFFLTLGKTTALGSQIFEKEITRGRRRNRSLIALISSEDFHIKVLKPLLLCLPLLFISIALLGSQSRGAWIGVSLALIVYTWKSSSKTKPKPELAANVVQLKTRKRLRNTRGRSHEALKMDGSWALLLIEKLPQLIKPLALITATSACLFFLNTKGRELIAGRIEYGLLYSLDDIRWTFYADSWKLLEMYPFFGVGLGAWATYFNSVASPKLSGLNPVYLHSDPYQLIIELGFVGITPLVILAFGVVSKALKAISTCDSQTHKTMIIALFCSILAFSFSSLPEFPLRIPALSSTLAVVLALFCSYCEADANITSQKTIDNQIVSR